jgi:gas vesicle protein
MNKGAGVVAVAAAGFIAGMLLAPKSGKETREDIKHKANDAKKAAAEKADHMKHAMKDGMDSFHKGTGAAKSELTGFAESAKGLGREAKERAGRVSEKAKHTPDGTGYINIDNNKSAM